MNSLACLCFVHDARKLDRECTTFIRFTFDRDRSAMRANDRLDDAQALNRNRWNREPLVDPLDRNDRTREFVLPGIQSDTTVGHGNGDGILVATGQ